MHEIRFSIIVPTYNRPERLQGFLNQLVQLDYPSGGFEVVVIDDGSEPSLAPVVDQFSDRLNVVFLRQNHGGVAKGRHAGAVAARGRFLAFTDDDCLPAKDWLRKLEEALASRPNCAAGGRTVNALPQNDYSSATQALIGYLYNHFNADTARAGFFANNNMAMPRAIYHQIGGLDTTWPMCGEDRDLCARWVDHGYPMVYVPEAIVHHAHDLSFSRFWRQHFNYGRGAYRFHKTRANRGNGQFKLERAAFYLKLPFAGFKEAGGLRGFRIAALLLVSQLANTAGFVTERIKPKKHASA
jgi:GT2 family glycosyltransferase